MYLKLVLFHSQTNTVKVIQYYLILTQFLDRRYFRLLFKLPQHLNYLITSTLSTMGMKVMLELLNKTVTRGAVAINTNLRLKTE